MQFQPRQPPFLGVPTVMFTMQLTVGVFEKSRSVGDETRMQAWTELLQMLEVITTGSHSPVGSQAHGEVLMCSCGSFSQTVYRTTFNPLVVLWLRLEYIVNFQHGATDVIVQRVQSGHLFF